MSDGDQRLDAVLTGEHAAIYGYGVLGAHLTGSALQLARDAEAAHRGRRDALLLRLTSASANPPAARPAYDLPYPVTNAASAMKLAIELEERTGVLWRVAIPETTGDQRKLCLDSLTDCALRAARWRRATGQQVGTVALP
jgi:hypothetical protein